MTHSYKAQVDCLSVSYTHPAYIDSLWRATSQSGKYVDVVVAHDVPAEIIPYIVNRIVPKTMDAEYREILTKLEVKPNNVQRFFASQIQELLDALHDNVVMERIFISYEDNCISFEWVIRNIETNHEHTIVFKECVGKEITIEQFLAKNKYLSSREMNLTKRDIRKVFVIIKTIVKMFPKVSSKNTPLRGLYLEG